MGRPLPVDDVLDELVATLARHRAAVLQAPTGAGKTTRVPPALLDGGLAGDSMVVMLEPRRLAARAAARRMAAERGVSLGAEVGYAVRFDRKLGPTTRLAVMTEGVFVRRLQDDPFLEGIGAVVLDEFHERHLETDLALAMLRRVRASVRPELPLLVMSATLPADELGQALGDAPVVRCEGRLFPVDVRYLPAPLQGTIAERAVVGVRSAYGETDGDVLVFLPGVGEIRRTGQLLQEHATEAGYDVVMLYGDLPAEEQDRALAPGERRRVVLATNVAETSLTIEGITAVVDTGVARLRRYDPSVGLDRLVLEPISRASADQRAGRAGRTAPGFCARLWTRAEQSARSEHTPPEIERVDLSGPVLQLLAWGESDAAQVPWLAPPPAPALARAAILLDALGATEDERVTPLGRTLSGLPVSPRLARLLVEGAAADILPAAALAAALLSERDPVRRARPRGPGQAAGRGERSRSDILDRIALLEGRGAGLDRGAARAVLRARDQLVRLARARRLDRQPAVARGDEDERLLRALLAAFPDRLARRRERGSPRGVLVGGRGVRLGPDSAVLDADLFLCLDLDAGSGGARSEAVVRLASEVERSWLPGEALVERTEVAFDARRQAVSATRQTLYGDLVLDEVGTELPDDDRVAEVLAAAAADQLASLVPGEGSPFASLAARIAWLAEAMPELELPDVQPRELLVDLCRGRRALAELRSAPWADALAGRLDHRQRSALEQHAPERLAVPSGSRVALHYSPGQAPVLAVRIQELFGCADTPRVGGGRVPVVLHLLAPNMRAQQVTDDLAGFWVRTYPAVRRELSRRYPKHAWPEDPLAAAPQSRPGHRRR